MIRRVDDGNQFDDAYEHPNTALADDLKPCRDKIAEHLTVLFSDFIATYPDGLIQIQSLLNGPKNSQYFPISVNGIENASDFAFSENLKKYNVYVGVNPRKPEAKKNATNEDVEISLFNYIDCDTVESCANFETGFAKQNPTLKIQTGLLPNPRFHFYWKLESPSKDMGQWIMQQSGLIQYFNSDVSIKDPRRIMRLAGTINYPSTNKINKGYQACLVQIDNKELYKVVSIEKLSQSFPYSSTKPQSLVKELNNNLQTLDFPYVTTEELLSNIKVGNYWHDNMLKLTARMAHNGSTDNEILKLAPELTLEGYSVSQTRKEMLAMISPARKKWGHPDRDEPLFAIESAKIDFMLQNEPPPQKWIFNSVLPLGITACMYAPGGTGKTMLALQMAVGVAIGMNICETKDTGSLFSVTEARVVVCLFAEDSLEEISRRLYKIVKDLNLTEAQVGLLKRNLYIKSMVSEDNYITHKPSNGGDTTQTDYPFRLMKSLQYVHNLGLLIIDPASRFRGGSENSNEDATRFIVALEQIAQALSITILFLHHANKNSANNDASQGAARGASALIDGVRWAMQLSMMTSEQETKYRLKEQRGNYISINVTKNNYAKPQSAEIWLKRRDEGILERAQLTSQKADKQIETKSKIMQILGRAEEEYTITKFIRIYAGKNGELEAGEKAIVSILREMIGNKTIFLLPPLKPKQNVGKVLSLYETRIMH